VAASRVIDTAYCDFEIHHLVREGRYGVVEAEPVLSNLVRREHKVALSLLLAFQYYTLLSRLFCRAIHYIVDCIPCQWLYSLDHFSTGRTIEVSTAAHGEVECYLGARIADMCVEALLLVRYQLVCKGRCGGAGRKETQKGENCGERPHVGIGLLFKPGSPDIVLVGRRSGLEFGCQTMDTRRRGRIRSTLFDAS